MRPLHPPLSVIEQGLFGDRMVAEPEPEAHDDTVGPGLPDAPPAYLRQAFARRAASLSLPADAPLARGQVRTMTAIRGPGGDEDRLLAQPVALLLRMQVAGSLWRAWLVAAEADYASAWDVVLGERDAPLDPLAGMVQAWNEVSVVVDPQARLLGVLGLERMQGVEAVAAEHESSGGRMPGAPQPGLVAMRQTPDGHVLATGTALGHAGDPRTAYQGLYQRLARECEAAALSRVTTLASAPASKPGARTGGTAGTWWQSLGWRGAFVGAMVLVLVQGVGLLSLRGEADPDAGLRGTAAPSSRPALRVIFAPGATQERLQRALRELGANVVDGPNEHGEFVVELHGVAPADAIARLRASGLVDSAEVLQPGRKPH